jgi:hypothetical protein
MSGYGMTNDVAALEGNAASTSRTLSTARSLGRSLHTQAVNASTDAHASTI